MTWNRVGLPFHAFFPLSIRESTTQGAWRNISRMTQRTVTQSCHPTVKQSMVVAQQIWIQLDSPVHGAAAILHVNLRVSNLSIFYLRSKNIHWIWTNGFDFPGTGVCWASPEKGSRKSCVFPFLYDNANYSTCLKDIEDKAWCPTQKNSEGRFIRWAECDAKCPIAGKWNLTMKN